MNKLEVKRLIIDSLELEDITPDDIKSDEPLFIDGLGLDSIDALELGVALHRTYGIKMDAEDESTREHFYSVQTLVEFVNSKNRKGGEDVV